MTFINFNTLIQTISLVLYHIFHQTNVNYFYYSRLLLKNCSVANDNYSIS